MDFIHSKAGYYSVGQELFQTKIPALIRSTQTNIDAEWQFHRTEFSKFNWKSEPTESLWTLYGRRAKQLREQYDYLILEYSGGADSKNILDIFLGHNLKIDEIVSRYSAKTHGNSWKASRTQTKFLDNLQSEWELTARLDFQWLANNHPEIKLTYHDWLDEFNISKAAVIEDHFMDRSCSFQPFQKERQDISKIKSVFKYPRVGIIYGIDKPKIAYQNNNYYLYFLDVGGTARLPVWNMQLGNATVELFYWSPDSEEILRKQAHVVKQFFQSNPQLNNLIVWPPRPFVDNNLYNSIVNKLVYPTFDPTRFQVQKSSDNLISLDRIVLDHHTDIKTKFLGLHAETKALIDSKYYGPFDAYVGFISPFYEV